MRWSGSRSSSAPPYAICERERKETPPSLSGQRTGLSVLARLSAAAGGVVDDPLNRDPGFP
jgi:hypothetical protein